MAFLLRNISRSADGREIVRTSRVNDDLLKVGRDPDCDIRLNDLAVALHHATLELVSATKLGVSGSLTVAALGAAFHRPVVPVLLPEVSVHLACGRPGSLFDAPDQRGPASGAWHQGPPLAAGF